MSPRRTAAVRVVLVVAARAAAAGHGAAARIARRHRRRRPRRHDRRRARLAEEYRPDVLVVDGELAPPTGCASSELKRAVPATRSRARSSRTAPRRCRSRARSKPGPTATRSRTSRSPSCTETLDRLASGDTVLHPDAASVLARRLAANGKETPERAHAASAGDPPAARVADSRTSRSRAGSGSACTP